MTDYRIFPSTNGPTSSYSDGSDYTLGTEFYVTARAWATKLHIWRPTTDMTSAECRLFRVDTASAGTALTDVGNFTLSGTGWQTFTLPTPVELVVDQRYRVVVQPGPTGNSHLGRTTSYWSSSRTNGLLVAPSAALATGADQCSYGFSTSPTFPTLSNLDANYWLDVTVTDVDPTGQTVAIGQAIETDTGGAVRPQRLVALAQVVESDTATVVARSKTLHLAQALEADTTAAVGRAKSIGLAEEADEAFSIEIANVNQAFEADTAMPFTALKRKAFGQAVETDTAGTTRYTPGQFIEIGQAVETDTADATQRLKTRILGRASESSSPAVMRVVPPVYRLIQPSRLDSYPIDYRNNMGALFGVRVSFTVYGDDAGLEAAECPASEILDAAQYVFYGGYDYQTEDLSLRDLWTSSGFEVEQVPYVELS